MNLGVCSNCRQKNEMHEGIDGLAYCEDCLVMLGKDKEGAAKASRLPVYKQPEPLASAPSSVAHPSSGKRDDLIDYIVQHADERWIDKLLKSAKDNYAWVLLIEKEPNDRVLLRFATELGYQAESKSITKTPITDGSSKEARPNLADRGSVKGSPYRASTKKASKSSSLSNT